MLDSTIPQKNAEALPAQAIQNVNESGLADNAHGLGELSDCLDRVRRGDADAIGQLYDRFLDRSVRLAKSRLSVGEDHLIDDEQAAMSALESLVVRVRSGSYADIKDQLTLWNLLARIINRKLNKYRRSMYGPTRSPDMPVLQVMQADGDSSRSAGIPVVGNEPSPLSVMIADDTLNLIIENLSDPDTRTVLLLRLEGYNDAEIAVKLRHSRNWVQRRGQTIRRVAKSLLREDE